MFAKLIPSSREPPARDGWQAVRPRQQDSVRQEACMERARWYRQCRDSQDVVRGLDLGLGHLKNRTACRGRNHEAHMRHAPYTHTRITHTHMPQ